MRYEDVPLGYSDLLGPREITLEDSLRFCSEFDRLPIHLDEEQAAHSIYGQRIASGLHTLSLTASIVVDGFLSGTSMTGASGMSEVRWYRPVLLPNQLTVRLTVLEKHDPKPGRRFGTVVCRLEALLQDDTLAMSAQVHYLFEAMQ